MPTSRSANGVTMDFHGKTASETAAAFSSDPSGGLSAGAVAANRRKFGANTMPKRKEKGPVRRLFAALCEPTLVILEFAWIITVGVNVGKFLKSGDGDVLECVGILAAILLSAVLTIVMEGRSAKAFELLGNVYDKISVKVVRGGKTMIVGREEVVCGDVILLGAGDKVIADGRLISAKDLFLDESMLTGESKPAEKRADVVLSPKTPLAERSNCVYSGTFVSGGTGAMMVTAVGENAELGKIASDLRGAGTVSAPLNQKLARLGRLITVIGGVVSALVFGLSIMRLVLRGDVDFFTVEDAFIEAIVLIVAAVPEGLPTTAAISLTLNVLKLAGSNALIRKLVAAETVGCVSVICSDKTGTLTMNKMTVVGLVCPDEKVVLKNAAINSTAVLSGKDGKDCFGSATEGALLRLCLSKGTDYSKLRKEALIGELIPFNSSNKYMLTEDLNEGVTYLKGAPEIVAKTCGAEGKKYASLMREVGKYQAESKRVIAFAHKAGGEFSFDGYAVIADPVRQDVKTSIENCRSAGIDVKMLTGDNAATAESIARELGLVTSSREVTTADEIDDMAENRLIELLSTVKVIARSTPKTKLKVVEALKKAGEVVAVTGDGVNDAPAIRHADIGIAMGSGSEITKEASDIVLLDDSFSTIVKAISFGRNIYRNFQRFIMFQLSVNLTAMAVVVASLVLGLENPFNAMQLLWIDIIMDGPPALTLALERSPDALMKAKPVKRTDGIVTFNMFARIVIHAAFMSAFILAEYLFDFLGAGAVGVPTAIFGLFVMFQLFNAFNCRRTNRESVFASVGGNKPMLFVFGAAFLLHILVSQVFCGFFGTTPLGVGVWLKIVGTAAGIVIFSEIYKAVYRFFSTPRRKKAFTTKIADGV